MENKTDKKCPFTLSQWIILIAFAATAFYVVYPKYTFVKNLRMNRITGEMCELMDVDENGICIFKKSAKSTKKSL